MVFPVVTPPAAGVPVKQLLAPSFTAGPTTLDPYRPWSVVTIDGVFFVANGFDAPKRWDGASTFYPMGSTAPTTFALALSSAGSPAALLNGNTATYYLVFFVSTLGKETAPQLTSGVAGVSIANASGSTRDVTVTWTDPGGEFDFVRIYRRLQSSDNYKLVATVAAATATYLDVATDLSLALATAYVTTWRTTLPPTFLGIAVVRGQLWGWVRGTAVGYYGQQVRIDSRFVADDFKATAILPIKANDAKGDIVALVERYSSATWYKQRGRYEMQGNSPTTFEIRQLSGDRGACSQRCIVELEGRALCLDEVGLYYDTPTADPIVAGARPGSKSPFQPIWERLNMAVADTFFALTDRHNRLVYFFVALDFEPIPNVAVVYDYGMERLVSLDTVVWGTAGGVLLDEFGQAHVVFGCDLGYLQEVGYGASQGVLTGTTKVLVSAATVPLDQVTASTASFDTTVTSGVPGTPFYRADMNGVVVDINRVYSATSTVLTGYYFSGAATASTDFVGVGCIPAVFRTATMLLGDGGKFSVVVMDVEHDNGVSGNLDVFTKKDADAFTTKVSIDLTTSVRDYVPCDDQLLFAWTAEFSQFDAGLGFAVRAIHIHAKSYPMGVRG